MPTPCKDCGVDVIQKIADAEADIESFRQRFQWDDNHPSELRGNNAALWNETIAA
jgi:hypothetical protein